MNRLPIEFAFQQMTRIARNAELARHFDLTFWGTAVDSHPLTVPEPDCGFSGCFIGWAAHQQWFHQFGLQLGLYKEGLPEDPFQRSNIVPAVLPGSAWQYSEFISDKHRTQGAVDALALLFDIDKDTLGNIIYEEAYRGDITVMEVRDRLGELLEHGEEKFNALVVAQCEAWDAEHADGGEP
jgi:hypothetical protein